MPDHHKEKTYDVGVIIGRFQVDELHPGHKHLIEMVHKQHKKVIILVGVTEALGTKDNPLDYPSRMGLFKDYVGPNVIIHPIQDVPSNREWSINVDRIIRSTVPIGSVRLYGGRDSFIEHYEGVHDTFEYDIISNIEGTKIRFDLGKEVIDSPVFRAGVIHSTQNTYPKAYPTVDIAVVKHPENLVLLGKKRSGTGLNFPGGFVDPTDLSLEYAALRELREEVEVTVHNDEVEYIGSCPIDDYRYKGTSEKIMTTFFMVPHFCGPTKAKEEFESVDWYSLGLPIDIAKSHAPLLEMLRAKLRIEGD